MTKKQTNWSRSFNERVYDRLAVTIPKGRKEAVKKYAQENGLSVNGLVNKLLRGALRMTDEDWKARMAPSVVAQDVE